jgi:chaperonin GroES
VLSLVVCSVVVFCDTSTGQEKIMAKKASSGGTRIVPLGDRVVLKRAEAEAKTAGGIVLPDSAQGKPQRGEIVAIGDGHVNDKGEKVPLTVKEGDRVIFSSYAGDEISFGDQTFLLMRESDILAVL